jgi:hypothetical protein
VALSLMISIMGRLSGSDPRRGAIAEIDRVVRLIRRSSEGKPLDWEESARLSRR